VIKLNTGEKAGGARDISDHETAVSGFGSIELSNPPADRATFTRHRGNFTFPHGATTEVTRV
jgi:hypothetical protein